MSPNNPTALYRSRLHLCMRSNDLATAMYIYNEARSEGVVIEAKTYGSLLSLLSGVSPSDYLSTGSENKGGRIDVGVNVTEGDGNNSLAPSATNENAMKVGGKFTEQIVKDVNAAKSLVYLSYLDDLDKEDNNKNKNWRKNVMWHDLKGECCECVG